MDTPPSGGSAAATIKRTLTCLVGAIAGFSAVVGVEIAIAMRREYLPTEPALEIGGLFGPPDGRHLCFVVLGDSTAAGLGASAADNAYPTVLARRLGELGHRVELLVLGSSGARVKQVLLDQLPQARSAAPDLVFVGIGANDTIHLTPLSQVHRDMRELVQRLKSTGAAVVVAGAPDMRAAAFHQPLRAVAGWRGRRVASAIRAAAEAESVPVVPLAELAGPYFAENPTDAYGGDDFHPGDGGYRAWAESIYPYLRAALAQRATLA